MIELRGNGSMGFCDGMSRRAMLRIGGLAPLGLSLSSLLGASGEARGSFGRAKRCLMIFMWGGPSHIDLFDMKPHAPSEVRGIFKPIASKVPGIRISELLPNLARHTDKLGFIRSVTHSDSNHSTGAHWMLTGHKHPLAKENFGARPTDYPHMGSVISKLAPVKNGLPTFVALPQVIGTTAGFVTPGQNGGFLGRRFDPFVIDEHPHKPDFKVPGMRPTEGLDAGRIRARVGLSRRFDDFRRDITATLDHADLDAVNQRAYNLLTSPKVAAAFNLAAEGKAERERYGMQPFGQSLLMARRLLESGVKMVTVYWHRQEPPKQYSWDTHADNFNQLKDRLVPQIDQPLAHLLDDFKKRGLLDDTLIVWNSEFGRTPRVNKKAGRDHWGKCNTLWMAGAGVPGGQLYGKSDKTAAEPVENPVSPSEIAATIYHLLGLDPARQIRDQLQRPFPLAEAEPLLQYLSG